MTWGRRTAKLWLLAALTAGGALAPSAAQAMQAGFSAGAEADTLTLTAEPGQAPKYSVRRTGPQELTVTFDAAGEKAPAPPGVGGSKLVAGVRSVPGGFKILLKTNAFSYVNSASAASGQVRVQVFQDSVGALWTGGKAEAKAEPKPEAKKDPVAEKAAAEKKEKKDTKAEAAKAAAEKKAQAEKSAADKKAEAERQKAEKQAEKERQETAKAEEAQRKKAEAQAKKEAEAAKKPAPAQAEKADPAPATPAPEAPKAEAGQPFFSVPYSMRAPVNKTVIGLPPGGTATLPPIAGQPQAPEKPAGPEKAKAPAAPARPEPAKEKASGGKVPPGVVEKPILQEQSLGTATPPAPAAAAPAQPAAPPVDVGPDKGQSEVRFRADRRGPEDARPAELVSGAPVKARLASSEAPSHAAPAAGAPVQQQNAWELRQPVQKLVLPSSGAANATLPPVAQAQETHPPQPEAHAGPAAAPEHAPAAEPAKETAKEGAKEGAKDAHAPAAKEGAKDAHGKEAPAPLSEDQLKDKLVAAQATMVAGQWPKAIATLEELLREPALKGDTREEALYSLADAYMQGFRDAPAANYDKIAGAQQAAMNANQKSARVPRALLNLGLLNLKVGNLPEARAYFNIIKKKYPLDQNAATIPFSLGEHYRNKGDLAKAAEQYQSLIKDYPDSRLAKDTAYLLAQTLRRLGSFEKAYQIVDYLDKRWDTFYLAAPDFLRLQAEVEEKVGKLAQAKDHYWTYYNLNPASEFADVTLVRIGDIYLKQNRKAAAKEVYQKAIHDFPDREGGLVARMRAAEEGAYDDPTMTEMVSVFSRPEAQKPNETYEHIASKYPQSPLAPLALIKLGMWHFYSKAYQEAMNTAASFLEKYPKSPLVPKAKELGFQSFLLALPALVQEGNYQRIMQMYDTSDFVKENKDKLGDEALMAIAVSAWKRGDPDRALKLAGRFLGKTQVPKYSEMALDLAMNIFMEKKDWRRIDALASRAGAAWKLSPRQKAQFEQARAMALENQGESEKSLPLWTRIASDTTSDPATRAYATYVLAKDAAKKQDMVRLFALAQEALTQLLATGGDKDKIKDCLLMSITATERSGRYAETLKWGKEFDRIIPDSDPEWAPLRMRLAEIYRRGNMPGEWRALLQDVAKKKPGTVYARMATQALEGSALDKRLQNYLQTKGGQ